jgi:hypothetical protein
LGRASDAKSEIAEIPSPADCCRCSIWAIFLLEWFRRVTAKNAFWISRFQNGAHDFDAAGKSLDLRSFFAAGGGNCKQPFIYMLKRSPR